MLIYRFGPTEITITFDDPAPLDIWLAQLRPLLLALHGPDGPEEMRQIEQLAHRLMATPGATYGVTGRGLLTLTHPDYIQPSPATTTCPRKGL